MKGIIFKTDGGEVKMKFIDGYIVLDSDFKKEVATPDSTSPIPRKTKGKAKENISDEEGTIKCMGSSRLWSPQEVIDRKKQAIINNRMTYPNIGKDGNIRYKRNEFFDPDKINADSLSRSERAKKSFMRSRTKKPKVFDADVEEAEDLLEKADNVEIVDDKDGLVNLNQEKFNQ